MITLTAPELAPLTLPAAFSLEGRVAVVTGAGGLLGAQHCHALAAAGAEVVAIDIDVDACHRVADDVADATGQVTLPLPLDLRDPDAVAAACGTVMTWREHVDVLVNNAGLNDVFEPGVIQTFESFPLDRWQHAIDVNLTGTFLCAQQFGAVMAHLGSGSIINVASTYGVVAPNQRLYRSSDGVQRFIKSPAYPVTKSGVLALTRYLAAYWGNAGVRVNALSPGGVEDGQDEEFRSRYADGTMLGRMAHPTDYAGALVFLASDASRYMTGANLIVDGGWTAW